MLVPHRQSRGDRGAPAYLTHGSKEYLTSKEYLISKEYLTTRKWASFTFTVYCLLELVCCC